MDTQEELDRIESEAYAQMEREEMEEAGLTVFENGQTVQDLAEEELKYEERMHKFLWDDKYALWYTLSTGLKKKPKESQDIGTVVANIL